MHRRVRPSPAAVYSGLSEVLTTVTAMERCNVRAASLALSLVGIPVRPQPSSIARSKGGSVT
jgi:hypothetical protein